MVDLLRQFQHLKLILSTVVENAQTVAHNLPDHNHSAQEAKKTFNRVSTFGKIYLFLLFVIIPALTFAEVLSHYTFYV